MGLLSCCQNINRKKSLNEHFLQTDLRRCLGIFDLTLLGVSGMLGAGLYVLTGAVAKNTAGPAIILSYLAAAIAAFMSALCYAEFGSRIPTTGSAYIFTYVTMGEVWGFLIGWNMVLEHGIGSASVAKAWSGYLDSVLGYPIKTYLTEHVPFGNGQPLGEYPDFVGALVILLLCGLVASGVKSSTRFNIIFAVINIGVVLFIIGTGFFLANPKNWTEVDGGFAPFGFSGIIAGASRCFFAFAGFDVIASSCEEARNPKRDIPIALAISLLLVTVSYIGVSSVVTLMVPWYDIVPKSAISDAYGRFEGWEWAQVVVTAGSLCTMTTSMFSGLFIMPRILYAISKDGLLCPALSYINEKTQVPLTSVGFTAVLCSTMALLFDLETLVQFMSIGTLTAYSFVAACVILLRYGAVGDVIVLPTKISPTSSNATGDIEHTFSYTFHRSLNGDITITQSDESISDNSNSLKQQNKKATQILPTSTTKLVPENERVFTSNPATDTTQCLKNIQSIGNLKPKYKDTIIDRYIGHCKPGVIVLAALVSCIIFSAVGMLVIFEAWHELSSGCWWPIVVIIISCAGSGFCFFLITVHQQHSGSPCEDKSFKVPFVPFLPCLCICTNIFFMLKLQAMTWIRLVIWLSVGVLIYFTYGYHKSQLNPIRDEEQWYEKITRKVVLRLCPKAKFFTSNQTDQEELISNSDEGNE